MGKIVLPALYLRPRIINAKKVSDLMELLNYVPPIFHGFYKQIQGGSSDSEEEPPLASGEED